MRLGFIGLGRMGSRMVVKLLTEGYEVVVWNRTKDKISLLRQGFEGQANFKNLSAAKSIEDLVEKLDKPRVVWLMLPARSTHSAGSMQASSGSGTRSNFSGSEAGDPTQEILDEIEKYIEEGDIVIDGGNAHWRDTQERFEHFQKRGVSFLGIGVSGGIIAAREGYPLMVGGSKKAYDYIRPILESLAKPRGGYEYFGEGGAGHFVKMVHNGIEYGIMQSIGEGFGILEKSPYNLGLAKVAKLYQKGTLVSGFMMQRTIEALEKDPKLSSIEGYIEESGEGRWTVQEAKKLGLPVEVIEKSLEFRQNSRKDKKVYATFAARLVAALRAAFGGHEVKKKCNP